MEAVSLLIATVALIGAGCAATVLSAHIYPLWMRVRGQAHGRYAGLSAAEASLEQDSDHQTGKPGHVSLERPAQNLIVA